ncbi:hypothetical protein MEO41_28820, partial [Dolichospermum sp. ST_sed4]|nr:hypothetical protein [Dolichospermum sp. ST_sed4]
SLFAFITLSDTNAQWLQTDGPNAGEKIRCMIVKDSVIFSGTYNNGLYKSTDFGSTWSNINTGFPVYDVFSLAVNDSIIFAGTNNGVLYSKDTGISWNNASIGIASA